MVRRAAFFSLLQAWFNFAIHADIQGAPNFPEIPALGYAGSFLHRHRLDGSDNRVGRLQINKLPLNSRPKRANFQSSRAIWATAVCSMRSSSLFSWSCASSPQRCCSHFATSFYNWYLIVRAFLTDAELILCFLKPDDNLEMEIMAVSVISLMAAIHQVQW